MLPNPIEIMKKIEFKEEKYLFFSDSGYENFEFLQIPKK